MSDYIVRGREPHPDEHDEDKERRRLLREAASSSGHHTGRCGRCHSSNLWDDNLTYGCNDCGVMFVSG